MLDIVILSLAEYLKKKPVQTSCKRKNKIMLLYIFSGTIGHVAHGKSTVVKALSGVQVCFSVFKTKTNYLRQRLSNMSKHFYYYMCSA